MTLTWIHFGDLYASEEGEWKSLGLLERKGREADRHLAWETDFAFLPGDNANHGEPEQYRRIRDVLDDFALRWFAIPVDHDFEPKSLANFYEGLGVSKLPLSVNIKGHRCLFLDIISPGTGGPDFWLGAEQAAWLEDQLDQSQSDPARPVVFMHAFPGDLSKGGEALARSFADHGVVAIDTGHTHYNEVLNVLITSPADHRLVVDPTQADQAPRGAFSVRAKIFGEDIDQVTLTVDDRPSVGMAPVAGSIGLWTAEVVGLVGGRRKLTVTAASSTGETDSDTIEIEFSTDDPKVRERLKSNPGDHEHSIGPWPERGLLGTQLGPNKNGTINW